MATDAKRDGPYSVEQIASWALPYARPQECAQLVAHQIGAAIFDLQTNYPDLLTYCMWALPLSFKFQEMWLEALAAEQPTVHDSLRTAGVTLHIPYRTVTSLRMFTEFMTLLWYCGHLLPTDASRMDEHWRAFVAELAAAKVDAWRGVVPELRDLLFPSDLEYTEDEVPTLAGPLDRFFAFAKPCAERLPPPPPPAVESEFTAVDDLIESAWSGIETERAERDLATRSARRRNWPMWSHCNTDRPQCPLSFDRLQTALRGIRQGTPTWLFMRRFFIGATGLKTFDGLDKPKADLIKIADDILCANGDFFPDDVDWVSAVAMAHGTATEDMAREGYLPLMHDEFSDQQVRILEYGMSPASYLWVFFAQSPDGVVQVYDERRREWDTKHVMEIKSHFRLKMPYTELPAIYFSQCLQATIAHGVTRCDFCSMRYKIYSLPDVPAHYDDKAGAWRSGPDPEQPPPFDAWVQSPDTVFYTAQKIQFSHTIQRTFRCLCTAMALLVQLRGTSLLMQRNASLYAGERPRRHFARAQQVLVTHLDKLRSAYRMQSGINVTAPDGTVERSYFKTLINDCECTMMQLPMNLERDFFRGDSRLKTRWYCVACDIQKPTTRYMQAKLFEMAMSKPHNRLQWRDEPTVPSGPAETEEDQDELSDVIMDL